MAPISDSFGATRGAPSFVFGRTTQPQPSNEPDVIELDDDDDDEDERDSRLENSVDEMDQDESDGNDENDYDEDEGVEEGEEDEEDEEEEEDTAESVVETNGIDSIMDGFSKRSLQSSPALRLPPPSMFTSSGIQEALHPLRRTADRVTRQMQAFAEKLDRFKQQDRTHGSYQAAYSLIKSYQQHASDSIKDASRQSTLRKAKLGWSTTREPGQPDAKTEEDMRRLQLEVDTWDLFLNLIAVEDPSAVAHVKESQKAVFQNLHRYSTDKEIWDQFLVADNYSAECVMVLKWLETKAKSSSQHLDKIIANLEAQADRGTGLWAHGWLYTKESIKGQKRLRAWPQPLEPGDPGLLASLLSSENKEPLITQLDPDAIIRQKQGLQKQDQFYEQATWLTCWKMLRQGEPWTKIQEWSQERLESWRAVSLCGSSVENQTSGTKQSDDSMTRMMNCRSQDTWRAACSALARNPNTGDYEKAVYALLSGETEPAYQVCLSWDDHLYVFYNSILITRYRTFCSQFSRKLSHSPLATVPFVPEPMDYHAIQRFLESLKAHETIGMEARNPYLTIQAAILGKNFDSFFQSMANAASESSRASGNLSMIPDIGATGVDRSALIAVGDRDALRIITHLYIITQSLSYTRTDSHFSEITSLNVIAYAENLRQAELTEWIPLYVSFLPPHLAPGIIVQVLVGIVEPREKSRITKLLGKHGINIQAVQETLCDFVIANTPKAEKSTITMEHKTIRNHVKKDVVLMPVSKKFAGKTLSMEIERLIRCLEWYVHLEGDWTVVSRTVGYLYKRFYCNGMLVEARELGTRVNLSQVSLKLLGWDVRANPDIDELMDENSILLSPTKSPSKRSRFRRPQTEAERISIAEEAAVVLDLEFVIWAYSALEEFQELWEQIELHKNSPGANDGDLQILMQRLELAIESATEHAEALVDKEFGVLTQKTSDDEEKQLAYIRKTYFPDIILNYLCAVYYASLKLTRGLVLRSMEFAVVIAEDNYTLDCFRQSQRLGELAEVMALTSAAMVNAPETQTRKKPDGFPRLDIWNIDLAKKNDDIGVNSSS